MALQDRTGQVGFRAHCTTGSSRECQEVQKRDYDG